MNNKFDINVIANLKYMSPEEVVDAYEEGLIPASSIDLVKTIVENAETARPVTFNTWSGKIHIVKLGESEVLARNAQTELSDKMTALLSFYGDKISLISNYEIETMLNKALNNSHVLNIEQVESHKKFGKLNEDGTISTKTFNFGEEEYFAKQKID